MITAEAPQNRSTSQPSLRRFGAHEAEKEIYCGALASIYLARAAGVGQGGLAIKFFHPPPAATLQRALAIEGFLATAEAQRLAAEGGATSVAAVVDAGVSSGGSYLVRPFFRQSLQIVTD